MKSGIVAVIVPKWGLEMTEGTVSSWLKSIGDSIARGEPILEIESEKIVNTVDAPADGILRRITLDAGSVGSIGSLAGVIADAGVSEQDIDSFVDNFRAPDAVESRDAPAVAVAVANAPPVTTPVTSAALAPETGVRVSPPVRRLAERLGVSLEQVRGSGPNGRILQEDVERAAKGETNGNAATDDSVTLEPWSATRRSIAKKMQDSAREIPHFYLVMDVAADAIIRLRESLRAAPVVPSVNDLIVHATAKVLPRHPRVNANYSESGLLSFKHAHIAVAVATSDGVLAPIARYADRLSLEELSRELAALRQRVTERRLGNGDLDGGSFTVSNLGMHGIREFTSIITAPQCASLAVGAIRETSSTAVLSVTLSCDHRALDGAAGAVFLRDLKETLENIQVG